MSTIAEIRIQKGLTQLQLASKLGISLSTISKLENGKAILKPLFILICNELGVNPDEMTDVMLRGGVKGKK